MGLKTFTIDVEELSKNETIRLWLPFVLPKIRYKYDSLNNYFDLCESGKRPKGGIRQEDEGEAISLGGEQINVDGTVDLSKIPYVSYDFYDIVRKGKVKDRDILICKDGALTGKTCFVDFSIFPSKKVMVNEHIYILRGNDKVNQKFLFYYTRNDIFQSQVRDLAYRKKAQPGLNYDHLKKIKIPLIPKLQQNKIVAQIEPIEQKIRRFKTKIKDPKEVINKIFVREFGFDLEQFEALKTVKISNLDFSAFANNKDLRNSVKFHRQAGQFALDELKKKNSKKIKVFISEPIVLGKGISPKQYDDENGKYCYLSMATIKNWKFEKENARLVSDEFADDNQNKTIQINDIILARSGEGTIGKVAIIDDELNAIFADFTMRIRLQDYNHLFAYYYFRTEYFQYLVEINKKGLGNNTNIFPNQIQEFPLLDISLEEQKRIVDEIKTELNSQEEIISDIKTEIKEIDEIIESAIKNS